jgi:hypothetical protein
MKLFRTMFVQPLFENGGFSRSFSQCGLFLRYPRDTADPYLVAILRSRREPEWNIATPKLNQEQMNEAQLPGLHMPTGSGPANETGRSHIRHPRSVPR